MNREPKTSRRTQETPETPHGVSVNARQLGWLIAQAEAGHHPLFDTEMIARALDGVTPEAIERVGADGVATIVEQLANMAELEEARGFIRTLPQPTQDVLVVLYFRILDDYLGRRSATLH